jgi:hypothetical protein
MRRHLPTVVLSALLLALIAWYFWPGPPPSSLQSIASATATSTPLPQSKTENPQSKILSPPPPPAERSTLADDLHSPATPPRRDLQLISEILGTFRSNFPREGNPFGLNSEITAALTGQNKLRLALIPPDHPAINRTTRELLDRYGTPYFFHAESGTRMSITSAGPDKKLHTSDDETFTP